MEIRTLGVVGAGQMGSGIAHVAAASGLTVFLADLEGPYLAKARASIERNLEREVAKGKRSPQEKAEALDRITTSPVLSSFSGADLVIEAVVEDEESRRISSASSTRSARIARSSHRTPRRSPLHVWPERPGARTVSSACTS